MKITHCIAVLVDYSRNLCVPTQHIVTIWLTTTTRSVTKSKLLKINWESRGAVIVLDWKLGNSNSVNQDRKNIFMIYVNPHHQVLIFVSKRFMHSIIFLCDDLKPIEKWGNNKFGLSCAELSSSWDQAYYAPDYKIISRASLIIWKMLLKVSEIWPR